MIDKIKTKKEKDEEVKGILRYSLDYLKMYFSSFRIFKEYNWKILWMILIDIFYVFLFYLIFMFSYASITNQYMNELLPTAQKVGILKQTDSPEEIKELTKNLFNDISKEGDMDKIKSSILFSSGWFVGKIVLALITLLLLTSLTRALVWSFIKKNFKKFHKFVLYNFVWIVFCVILLFLMSIIIKTELLTMISLLLLLLYLYFSLILRIKYDSEQPLFKQMLKNIGVGVTRFIYYIPAFILISLTLIIVLSIVSLIALLLQSIVPAFIIGMILILTLLILITWSRIYLYTTNNKVVCEN